MKLKLTLLAFLLLAGCIPAPSTPTPTPTQAPASTQTPTSQSLPADEIATLSSLEKLDDYPLYTMRYTASYDTPVRSSRDGTYGDVSQPVTPATGNPMWGCSLFATFADPAMQLYGRNFDWRFSPAVLLFTDPPDGNASVSMVDIEYLGFAGEPSKNLLDLSLEERQPLLDAPFLPFDGMNDQGLAIGMAAVPASPMPLDPEKDTIGELAVMREVLDHASTVDEAIDILSSYNIDMSSVPIHYLVASASGESALVEFYQGEMRLFRNENPWQVATNFLVASTGGNTQGQCPRYDRISDRLQDSGGQLTASGALDLLDSVSQSHTQWSVVYDMAGGEISIVMGQDFAGKVYTLQLNLVGR